ncbi:hypothetical protein Bpfe_012593 [Biomphalaria pfeifferi]|uniref:Uncharacterized protein n=1 Tax=Biomphalaria pfeifferi TaxID=112525 RepID=A0AAD8BNS9_BIOPF|nr:hypothetical protein Bpfe_012593 [Biomphalaria pfeifferi]
MDHPHAQFYQAVCAKLAWNKERPLTTLYEIKTTIPVIGTISGRMHFSLITSWGQEAFEVPDRSTPWLASVRLKYSANGRRELEGRGSASRDSSV